MVFWEIQKRRGMCISRPQGKKEVEGLPKEIKKYIIEVKETSQTEVSNLQKR